MHEQTQPGFAELGLSPALLTVVAELGYDAPTPIQRASIPVLLGGGDLIGQSQTGSGKTAAFALPLLDKLRVEDRIIQALVLCPTRELCTQVARELRKLGRKLPGLAVLVVSGGEPIHLQTRALERGVHVVVGTPGRVLDQLRRNNLELRGVETVVLDEADRMLDMGFEADMDQILGALPRRRQSALFSATFPDAIDTLSRAHLRDPARVSIDEAQQAGPEIEQRVLMTAAADEDKYAALLAVLDRHPCPSALVFCNLKATVAELTRALAAEGLSVACLHGDLEQFDRNRVMAMFRNRSVRLLIATDVAARGLDVEDLELVINYDLPRQAETYLHRIGRTGRAGKEGLALSLATTRERGLLEAIARLTGTSLPCSDAPLPADDGGANRRQAWAASMDTIQISGGRKQKVRPGDILGALTGEAGGLAAADVGKIEIHDHLAHVAVAKAVSRAAVRALDDGRIKGKRFRATLVRAC